MIRNAAQSPTQRQSGAEVTPNRFRQTDHRASGLQCRDRDFRHAQRLDSQGRRDMRPGWRDYSLRQHPPGAGIVKSSLRPRSFCCQTHANGRRFAIRVFAPETAQVPVVTAIPIASSQSIIRNKAVGFPFMPEIACRAVAWDEGYVVAQRPQFLGDRIDQILVVSTRKISSADAALEKHVTHDREAARPVIEDDMSRRVSRAMDYIERKVAYGYRIAILQPSIGFKGFGVHAPASAVIVQLSDPEAVVLMRAFDLEAQLLRQDSGLPAMVEMTVCDEQLFKLHPRLRHRSLQLVEISTRIDQRALVGFGTPEERAILRKWSDRNDRRFERWLGVRV